MDEWESTLNAEPDTVVDIEQPATDDDVRQRAEQTAEEKAPAEIETAAADKSPKIKKVTADDGAAKQGNDIRKESAAGEDVHIHNTYVYMKDGEIYI